MPRVRSDVSLFAPAIARLDRLRLASRQPKPTLQAPGFSAHFGISEIILDGEVEAALLIRPSRPERGALRNVINAGRGAVDAEVLLDGQHLKRTAKTCGPDIAVLVSSLRKPSFPQMTVAKEPFTGESTR